MAQIGRPGLAAVKKDELWARFRDGESFTTIARALGKQWGRFTAWSVCEAVLRRPPGGVRSAP